MYSPQESGIGRPQHLAAWVVLDPGGASIDRPRWGQRRLL